MINIAIFVSGRGSNMRAVLEAVKHGILKDRYKPVICITDNPNASAIDIAREYRIPAICVKRKKYSCVIQYEKDIKRYLEARNVEFIVLVGYRRLVKLTLLSAYLNKIINIHPSLLPAFPGINAQKQAFDYGVQVTGCTVHFVNEGIDTGRIILQKSCRIMEYDTLDVITNRILRLEHIAIVEAMRKLYVQNYFGKK